VKGDLHVHSRISDGSLSIEEIVREAVRLKIDFLSITDHDTTQGIDTLVLEGRLHGIITIPGVEVSAYDRKRKRKVHLLGYGFETPANAIEGFCEPTRIARDEMTRRQVDVLRDAGYPITIEEVEEEAAGAGVLYKQHIMAVLTKKGLADGVRGTLYEKLFKNNGICSQEIQYPDVFDALKAIHADGGAAVLAHPGQFDSWELLEELIDEGLDGIEIFHPDHEFIHHCKSFSAALNHSRLILTGGSDFHGAYGRAVSLGEVRSPRSALVHIAQRCRHLPRREFSSIFDFV
jgi:hypothetical protein